MGKPLTALQSLGVCALYGSIACALILLNKALLSVGSFSAYFTLLGAKLVLVLAVCAGSRLSPANPLRVPAVHRAALRSAALPAALFVANAVSGFVALQLVPVPLFNCLRRLVPVAILAYEYAVRGRVPDRTTGAAVAMIAGGALLAGWGTFAADARGAAVTLLANVLTAASLVAQRQFAEATPADASCGGGSGATKGDRISTWGVLFYTALLALPACGVLAVATGEHAVVAAYAADPATPPAFWAGLAASTLLGLALTASMAWATIRVSPMATSITGNVKDLATTALGVLLFAGFELSATALAGLALSFGGAFLYSWAGLAAARLAAAAPPPAAPGRGAAAAAAGGGGVGARAASFESPASASADTDEVAPPSERDALVGGGGGAGGAALRGGPAAPGRPL